MSDPRDEEIAYLRAQLKRIADFPAEPGQRRPMQLIAQDALDHPRPDRTRRVVTGLRSRDWIPPPGATFEDSSKFDVQFEEGKICARHFALLMLLLTIDGVITAEVKSESWKWVRTGNLAIELSSKGRPSGIMASLAHYWVHYLMNDDRTAIKGIVLFPTHKVRELALAKRAAGKCVIGGDNGETEIALLSLHRDLLVLRG